MDTLGRQSFRGFLDMVRTRFPEEFLHITAPVDPHYETTALVFELERLGRSPVVQFDNVTGHDLPLVTNIAGSRKLLAAPA